MQWNYREGEWNGASSGACTYRKRSEKRQSHRRDIRKRGRRENDDDRQHRDGARLVWTLGLSRRYGYRVA